MLSQYDHETNKKQETRGNRTFQCVKMGEKKVNKSVTKMSLAKTLYKSVIQEKTKRTSWLMSEHDTWVISMHKGTKSVG